MRPNSIGHYRCCAKSVSRRRTIRRVYQKLDRTRARRELQKDLEEQTFMKGETAE